MEHEFIKDFLGQFSTQSILEQLKLRMPAVQIPKREDGTFTEISGPAANFISRISERYSSEKRLFLYKYYMRITDEAKLRLVNDSSFEEKFMNSHSFNAVILSADIRDSSALVSENSNVEEFAEFINTVIEKLSNCVKNNFGIYDKFTGDGILAVFPEFYSEGNAPLYAMNCARECHEIYGTIYSKYAKFFDGTEHGLGIGISSGLVYQSGTETEFTAVGKPVVTACRLSGAVAGHTYVSPELWQQICTLGEQERFVRVSEKDSYVSKGRSYPMLDLDFASVKDAQKLNHISSPSWSNVPYKIAQPVLPKLTKNAKMST